MTSYVPGQLSCTLAEEEAVAIAEQTHLFGYRPEIMRLPKGTRLIVHSDADARKVQELRDQMRSRS